MMMMTKIKTNYNTDLIDKVIILVNIYNGHLPNIELFTASVLRQLDFKTFTNKEFNKGAVATHKTKFLREQGEDVRLGKYLDKLSTIELPIDSPVNKKDHEINLIDNKQTIEKFINNLNNLSSRIDTVMKNGIDYVWIVEEYNTANSKSPKQEIRDRMLSISDLQEIGYDLLSPLDVFKTILKKYVNLTGVLKDPRVYGDVDSFRKFYDGIELNNIRNKFNIAYDDEALKNIIKKYIDMPSTKFISNILPCESINYLTDKGTKINSDYINKLKKEIKIDNVYYKEDIEISGEGNSSSTTPRIPSITSSTTEDFLDVIEKLNDIPDEEEVTQIIKKPVIENTSRLETLYNEIIELINNNLNNPDKKYQEYLRYQKFLKELEKNRSEMLVRKKTMDNNEEDYVVYDNLRHRNITLTAFLNEICLDAHTEYSLKEKYRVAIEEYGSWLELSLQLINPENNSTYSWSEIDKDSFIKDVCEKIIDRYEIKYPELLKEIAEKAKTFIRCKNERLELDLTEAIEVDTVNITDIPEPEKTSRISNVGDVLRNTDWIDGINKPFPKSFYLGIEKDELNGLLRIVYEYMLKYFATILSMKLYEFADSHRNDNTYMKLQKSYMDLASSPPVLKGYLVSYVYYELAKANPNDKVLSKLLNSDIDDKLDYLENNCYLGVLVDYLDTCFDKIINEELTDKKISSFYDDINRNYQTTTHKTGKEKYNYRIVGYSDIKINDKNKKEY